MMAAMSNAQTSLQNAPATILVSEQEMALVRANKVKLQKIFDMSKDD